MELDEKSPIQASSGSDSGVSMHDADGDEKPFSRSKPSQVNGTSDTDVNDLKDVPTLGKFKFRPDNDEDPQDWWFASTAIPLIAATTGPLANVLSIAALVTPWRNNITDGGSGSDEDSVGFPDPHWCIALNIASLVCALVGNLFLLFNFTRRIRYIIALPATIILWYFASGILIAITVAINKYVPPHRPEQTYSQGFWHAVIAACLYLFSSMVLMVNMLGYFLGHYPQHFTLTNDQRNLILQTMMFFLWLAGGAAVFEHVCGWSYADALYFCDVTVLTVGFGDFAPPNNLGRGLVFPFSVGGIIILGLMVSSLHRFAKELSRDNVVKKHVEKKRVLTVGRTVTTSTELQHREDLERRLSKHPSHRPVISRPIDPSTIDPNNRTITFNDQLSDRDARQFLSHKHHKGPLHATMMVISAPMRVPARAIQRVRTKLPKILLMREEKDRFDAMRAIQHNTAKFKKWYALTLSVIAFGLVWCVGAVGFWQAEQHLQGLSYFEALYFCYVSLLTIGYGDLAPKSNAGKPLFIVWSLIAVPTMTILVSDMGNTVVASFKRGTFKLADWTVLPKKGIYRAILDKNPWLLNWVQRKAEKKRIKKGFETGLDSDIPRTPSLEELANRKHLSNHGLARQLAFSIRKTADDLSHRTNVHYTYEEWVEFTRLIRFTTRSREQLEHDEEEEGVVDWDFIGENSPMLSDQSESEWVLDRLCESLLRYMKQGLRTEEDVQWQWPEYEESKQNLEEERATMVAKMKNLDVREKGLKEAGKQVVYVPKMSAELESELEKVSGSGKSAVRKPSPQLESVPESGKSPISDKDGPGYGDSSRPSLSRCETCGRRQSSFGSSFALTSPAFERRQSSIAPEDRRKSGAGISPARERRQSSSPALSPLDREAPRRSTSGWSARGERRRSSAAMSVDADGTSSAFTARRGPFKVLPSGGRVERGV